MSFDEILQASIQEAVAPLLEEIKELRSEVYQSKFPALLNRKQLMEFAGIKESKASELMNRQDFPVIREFGHPRVPTHLLFKWIDKNTDWMKVNSKYFERRGWGA